MRTNEIQIDRDSTIYTEDGQIWYHSYWTDGHKDSLSHNVITSDSAREMAKRRIQQLGKEQQDAESRLKSILDETERAKKYL